MASSQNAASAETRHWAAARSPAGEVSAFACGCAFAACVCGVMESGRADARMRGHGDAPRASQARSAAVAVRLWP